MDRIHNKTLEVSCFVEVASQLVPFEGCYHSSEKVNGMFKTIGFLEIFMDFSFFVGKT